MPDYMPKGNPTLMVEAVSAPEPPQRCMCGHVATDHNIDATWAPFGCYRVVALRFGGDAAGRLCECVEYRKAN